MLKKPWLYRCRPARRTADRSSSSPTRGAVATSIVSPLHLFGPSPQTHTLGAPSYATSLLPIGQERSRLTNGARRYMAAPPSLSFWALFCSRLELGGAGRAAPPPVHSRASFVPLLVPRCRSTRLGRGVQPGQEEVPWPPLDPRRWERRREPVSVLARVRMASLASARLRSFCSILGVCCV